MSFLIYKRKYIIPALLLGALGYLIGAIYYFPPSIGDWISAEETAKSLQMKMPFVEEARESMGLGICLIAMCIYLFVAYRDRKIQQNQVSRAA
jgi:hypothetical protein